jgi:hypothetical protein
MYYHPAGASATAAQVRAGATSPNGYTNINFASRNDSPAPKSRPTSRQDDPAIPAGAVNIGDILEAIFRLASEEWGKTDLLT